MNIKDIFIKPKQTEQRNFVTPSVDDYNTGFLNFVNFHNNSYMSLSAVFSAIELISNTVAEIPIDVKYTDDKDKTHRLTQHAVKFALYNSKMTRFMLIKSMLVDMLKHGNGFAYINRADDGTPTELIYCPATDVTIYYNKKSRELYYKDSNVASGKIAPSDMIHILKTTEDGFNGVSALKYAARTIESANYVENAALDYFAKGMHSVGLLHAKNPMRGDQADQAKKFVSGEINTTKNSNIVKFIPFDLEYSQLTNDPEKSQLLNSRLYSISEIARYFNVSPILLQDLSHGNVSDVESVNIQFLTQCVQPIITILEEELNRKLIATSEQDIFIDFDENELLRTNKMSTANYLSTLVTKGIISVNEAREMLGMNKVEGGDKLTVAYSDVAQNEITDK